MKILLLDKTASGEDLDYTPLAQFGPVWDCGNRKTEVEMLRLAAHPLYGDAEGILCNKAPMTAAGMTPRTMNMAMPARTFCE